LEGGGFSAKTRIERNNGLHMQTSLFDYELPESAIAQQPAEPRDSSRLLVLHRESGEIEHHTFRDITQFVRPGDLLIGNNSRVIPARLHGRKTSGGKVEMLLLKQLDDTGKIWTALTRGRGLREGTVVLLGDAGLQATIGASSNEGVRQVEFSESIWPHLASLGETPLPPYITEYSGDSERYQTVYGQPEGSAAAPTAGLHFTPELLLTLREMGVPFDTVTLHIGLDTFRPIGTEQIEEHKIHTEWAEVRRDTAKAINETTLRGGRIIAVGTTAVRTLEWAATGAQGLDPYDSNACPWQRTAAFAGDVGLYITPGYRFRAVDALITNFHLPRSTLLLLVSAFIAQAHPDDPDMGRRMLLATYAQALAAGSRFYSFGDAMLIL
jgi:S-adenosylmethionine:tRNA ribosyltransferase-isomerase